MARVAVEFRRVSYDLAALIVAFQASGHPARGRHSAQLAALLPGCVASVGGAAHPAFLGGNPVSTSRAGDPGAAVFAGVAGREPGPLPR